MVYASSLPQSQAAGSTIVYVYVHEHEHVYGRATERLYGPEGHVLAVIIKIQPLEGPVLGLSQRHSLLFSYVLVLVTVIVTVHETSQLVAS